MSTWLQFQENVCIDKLDYIVNKYNNTYHSTTKMKPVDVKSNTYIDFHKENNKEGSKFKVGNHVRILKCKNILQKPMFQIGLKRLLWLKKSKILFLGHMLWVVSPEEKLLWHFTKNNYIKQIKKSLKLKK